MKIWLDDLHPAPDGWLWVKKTVLCMMWICSGNVTDISLDNDLGEGELEGYEILNWLEKILLEEDRAKQIKGEIPTIHIHTQNPVAAQKMKLIARRIEKLKLRRTS